MELLELAVDDIEVPSWNPNRMDSAMRDRLSASIERFGIVVPLVVRLIAEGSYETVGGAQRLSVLREMGVLSAPCIVVTADDTEARLMAQALNRIAGEDDLGLKAEVVRELLKELPQEKILELLPETQRSLQDLANLRQEDLAAHLQAWQRAQAARLHHLQMQLTSDQLKVVEAALGRFAAEAGQSGGRSPNRRGTALYLLCRAYLDTTKEE